MKNDFDFIKDKFDNDNIKAPTSLDEESAMNIIEDKAPKKIKLYQSKIFKSAVSLVACVAIVLSCTTILNNQKQEVTVTSNKDLTYFADYDELKTAVKNIASTSDIDMSPNDYAYGVSKEVSTSERGGSGTGSYGETYKQVDGVDEGDIVKNDGKYIYYVSPLENEIKIFEGNGTNPKLVTTIDDFEESSNDDIVSYVSIGGIYIYNNKLIVNTYTEVCKDSSFTTTNTYVYIYDISDVKNPKKISTFSQSGFYISSRLIGNKLYVVSNKSNLYELIDGDDFGCIPTTCENDGVEEKVKAENIYYTENPIVDCLIVLSVVDIDTGEKSTDTKAVLGADPEIYCNEENMYISVEKYKKYSDEIEVIKVSLENGNINFECSATVEGTLDDQFSMDEYNGYFRVATTTRKYNKDYSNSTTTNNLFVFDSQLNEVGEITGFAKNEIIQAVKFMNDIAYVITYESIDPLFVIDLSTPTAPKILGSVEIDGFSSQLLTISEDRVLGIGYSTEEGVVDTEVDDGIKLVLFDVSNKAEPKVLDTYVMTNAYSCAQYNHKAIMINKEQGYFAIDYVQYSFDTDNNYGYSGAITFDVKDDKINVTDIYDYKNGTENYDSASRCTYIDNVIYVLDDGGNIHAFEYNTTK